MAVIGIYNIKGGVGKTTTAVNLAYVAAADGMRVLVWDLDPQGSASYYYRVKPKIKGGGKALIARKRPSEKYIRATDFERLDLIPADISYRHMDLALGDRKKPLKGFSKFLKPLDAEYDYIFLDCPPGLTLSSENVFRASDGLLVPLIPTTLSMRTLDLLEAFRKEHDLRKLPVMPFFSMIDRRKKLHRETVEKTLAKRREFLRTSIPNASEVERMGINRDPLPVTAPKSAVALRYRQLWKEIEARFP